MALEAAATASPETQPLAWALDEPTDESLLMDQRPIIRGLIEGIGAGRPAAELARAFHDGMAAMLAESIRRVAKRTGLKRVALSGGCFANHLLLRGVWDSLSGRGLEVYIHRMVPPGDGGISLGQAVSAAARLGRGLL